MFNFPSSHYEILADVISHKYRSAIIPKYSRKRFENRLFVCDSNISCAGKVSFYNCTFNCDISQNRECITILPLGEAVFKNCTFKRSHSNSGLFLSGKNDYLLDESAQHITSEFFEQSIAKKNANFSNGRFARNIYDDLVMNHARRVVHLEKPTRKDLCTIIAEDFHQDCESVEQFD